MFGSDDDCRSEAVVSLIDHELDDLDALHRQVAEYFEMKKLEVKSDTQILSDANKRAEKILKETTENIDGRYETGLLWNADKIEFGESYNMALRRLEIVEKNRSKDPDLSK